MASLQGSSVVKNNNKSLGRECAAWGCESRGLVEFEGAFISSQISFFKFPSDPGLKKAWCARIKRIDGKDNFKVTKHTSLCEKHFNTIDIQRPPGGTRKRLVKGAKPFLSESFIQSQKERRAPVDRPSPVKKYRKKQPEEHPTIFYQQEEILFDTEENVKNAAVQVNDLVEENNKLKQDIGLLKNQLSKEKSDIVKEKFVEKCFVSDASCNHYTGLPKVMVFMELLFFLSPGVNGENVILYNNKNVTGSSSAGRPRKLSPLESLLLALVRLRRNFDIFHLGYLFQVSEGTVTNTIQTWVNFMYLKFGSICIWPTKEIIRDTMPNSMKEKFPSTRCIIDCVEFKVSVPSSLIVHKMMYSDYKSHTTVKVLVGIAPGGFFSFVSSAYPGSISDKLIVLKSGFLSPDLWGKGDAIMADRGFLIEDYCKPLGIELIIPAFLKGRDQLTEAELISSQQIASERIHVERMIQRLKCFHIFDRVIPVNMMGSLNQIISVCAILCNFQDPILKQQTTK